MTVSRLAHLQVCTISIILCRPEDALGAKLSSLIIWTFLKYTLPSMRLLVYSLSFLIIIMSLKNALSLIILHFRYFAIRYFAIRYFAISIFHPIDILRIRYFATSIFCLSIILSWKRLNTPLRFFADSKKTAARSAAGFSPTLSPIFLATFVKVSILGHARSGHQVRSSDHTLQKLYNRAPATVFEGKLWNFRKMIRSSVPTKFISWIFDIGDLRSGHFRDLPIISQWAKIKLPVLCFLLSLYEWNRIR